MADVSRVECCDCHRVLPKASFTSSQWKKKGNRKCSECNVDPETLVRRRFCELRSRIAAGLTLDPGPERERAGLCARSPDMDQRLRDWVAHSAAFERVPETQLDQVESWFFGRVDSFISACQARERSSLEKASMLRETIDQLEASMFHSEKTFVTVKTSYEDQKKTLRVPGSFSLGDLRVLMAEHYMQSVVLPRDEKWRCYFSPLCVAAQSFSPVLLEDKRDREGAATDRLAFSTKLSDVKGHNRWLCASLLGPYADRMQVRGE